MPRATFRFYEELNGFLPLHNRKREFQAEIGTKCSVKHAIEALGVPHTEVDLILVNGKSVDFGFILRDGDQVSVYPVFESLNIENVTRLRKAPLRKTRFVADVNLGDVAKYMRILGFDVTYEPTLSQREIVEISERENRIILTKSKNLLKFKDVTHAIFIRPGMAEEQTRKIIDFLDISAKMSPFSRCLRCNALLESIAKDQVLDRIPPKVRDCCNEFAYCRQCEKVYWEGTHMTNMKRKIGHILDRADG